jgi:hypothetical protein
MHVSCSVQPPSAVAQMHERLSNSTAMGFAIGISRWRTNARIYQAIGFLPNQIRARDIIISHATLSNTKWNA